MGGDFLVSAGHKETVDEVNDVWGSMNDGAAGKKGPQPARLDGQWDYKSTTTIGGLPRSSEKGVSMRMALSLQE